MGVLCREYSREGPLMLLYVHCTYLKSVWFGKKEHIVSRVSQDFFTKYVDYIV